jgi:predicted Rdx family selenoprotein
LLTLVPDAEIGLRRSSGGVFEIVVDGRLGYSKRASGRFPTAAEIAGVLA